MFTICVSEVGQGSLREVIGHNQSMCDRKYLKGVVSLAVCLERQF